MSDLNPLSMHQVEAEILRLSRLLTRVTEDVAHKAEIAAETDTAYDLAYARAMVEMSGRRDSVTELKAEALVACAEEYEQARLAQAVYEGAREQGRNLRTQLEALRTIAANIRQAVAYTEGRGG